MKNFVAIILFLLAGCGGGGGGSSTEGSPAIPEIRALPQIIDSGNDTRISVDLNNITSNEILVKFRFPGGLRYVRNSATLKLSQSTQHLIPSVLAVDSKQGGIMAFRLSTLLSQKEPYGLLTFKLRGISRIDKDSIQVDVDLNDPTVTDTIEFSFLQPRFTSESSTNITVLDDSPSLEETGDLAPLPTPTANATVAPTPTASTTPTP